MWYLTLYPLTTTVTDAVQHRQANWHSTSQLDRMMCALFVVFNLPPTALAVAVIPDDNYLWFFSLHKLFLWTSAHHIPNFLHVKVQTFDCDCKWQQSRSRSSLPSTDPVFLPQIRLLQTPDNTSTSWLNMKTLQNKTRHLHKHLASQLTDFFDIILNTRTSLTPTPQVISANINHRSFSPVCVV